jgi:hypothetical protein
MTGRFRNRAGWIAALAAVAVLAGCVAQPPAPTVDTQTVDAPTVESSAATPARKPAAEPVEPEIASAPAATPEPAGPAVDVPTPEKLLGMDRAGIVKILGQPSFRRRDAPALLMRYRDQRCILDLFLYPPAGPRETGDPKVEHVEARGVEGGRIATKTCIESVMKSRAARAPG